MMGGRVVYYSIVVAKFLVWVFRAPQAAFVVGPDVLRFLKVTLERLLLLTCCILKTTRRSSRLLTRTNFQLCAICFQLRLHDKFVVSPIFTPVVCVVLGWEIVKSLTLLLCMIILNLV